jgi:hypothetical protein
MNTETKVKQLSTKPFPVPKVFQLSPQLSEELKKVVGEIEWLLILKADGDYVNVAVPDNSPLIRLNGCNGDVELFKPEAAESYPKEVSISEIKPQCECEENSDIINDLLTPSAHAQLISIAYTADNDCICIGGHRFYRK